MVRRAFLVVAVGLVLCAALAVANGSTATYAGETLACPGPIVRAESGAAPLPAASNRLERALEAQCARHDHAQLVLAGVAALLGLITGAVVLTPRAGDGTGSKVDVLLG